MATFCSALRKRLSTSISGQAIIVVAAGGIVIAHVFSAFLTKVPLTILHPVLPCILLFFTSNSI